MDYVPRLSPMAVLPGCEYGFATVLRMITFRVILVALMDGDALELDADEVAEATSTINLLWSMSKGTEDIPPHLLDNLNARLHQWIPHIPNPLDLIIPTYETMWRVVAITIALVHEDHVTRGVFGNFIQHPTSTQFNQWQEGAPSAEGVIREVLRLHPPTRHISRSVPSHVASFIPRCFAHLFAAREVKVADIEGLQRSEVWGPSACAFDPMRHHPDRCTATQKQAYMPFGHGPLVCIAKTWAPQAAAIMVAAVFELDGLKIVVGEKLGGREGWDGWTISVTVSEGLRV